MLNKRLSWEEYFMEIAILLAKRSTCFRQQVGALLVRDRRILSTGYNGAPAGLVHCLDIGCIREEKDVPSGERHELCRAVHAEQNVIIQAAYHGISIKDSILYSTLFPCIICSKMLINAGVKKIFYRGEYSDKLSLETLLEAGIKVSQLK
jgi:dCMP deaminase